MKNIGSLIIGNGCFYGTVIGADRIIPVDMDPCCVTDRILLLFLPDTVVTGQDLYVFISEIVTVPIDKAVIPAENGIVLDAIASGNIGLHTIF